MTRSMALVAALLSGAISVQAAFAQSATPLSEICGDCKVEKVASCGAGKFLEGPNFDKDGILWMVGLMAGEVLKVSKEGQCTVAKAGLNFPGGTRFDKEGKLIITTRSALVSFDPQNSELTTLRSLYGTQGFRGLNDVIVDKQGGSTSPSRTDRASSVPSGASTTWRRHGPASCSSSATPLPSPTASCCRPTRPFSMSVSMR